MLNGFYSRRQEDRDINSFDNFQNTYKLQNLCNGFAFLNNEVVVVVVLY